MRVLASIQIINKIEPIPNADRIEVATVKGWKVVTRKGEYKEGDKVIYCEIDSFLPEHEAFEFLRKSSFKALPDGTKGFRLRTVKLRKQISQGLLLPLSILLNDKEYIVGDDVTELLGIIKYEPLVLAVLSGEAKGLFPGFLHKTDEERIQNIPEILVDEKESLFHITEKLDGCLHYSTRIMTSKGEIEIGRLVNQRIPVQVLSLSESTNELEYKNILAYHKYKREGNYYAVRVKRMGQRGSPKEIICTSNHKFYTGNGYKMARNLSTSDKLYHITDNLSFDFEQFLLGTLLGDSYANKPNTVLNPNISFGHTNHEYFQYKKNLLGQMLNEGKSFRGGFEGSKIARRGVIKTSQSISKLLRKYCYINGEKYITKDWAYNLSPIALAFWYQDDGSLHKGDVQKPRVTLGTHAYSYEEVTTLQQALKDKYNIESSIATKASYKGHQLSLNTKGSEIFFHLVSPYVCKSMRYKLPIEMRETYLGLDSLQPFGYSLMKTDVLSVKELTPSNYHHEKNGVNQYDLTVEHNHNYIAKGILTHNSSMTAYIHNDEFGVCSRNLDLRETEKNTFWKVARRLEIETKLRSINKPIAIFGELIGPGIQKNLYKLNHHTMKLFDVYDIEKGEYYNLKELVLFAVMYDFETVPILDYEYKLPNTIDELLELANRESKLSDVDAEGLVIRNTEGDRVSFKVLSNEFLLHEKE